MRRSPATAIGLVLGIGLLWAGSLVEGTGVTSFFNLPAALIVIGGTAGATLASVGAKQFRLIPALYRKAFRGEQPDRPARLEEMISLAEVARREGLLALDERIPEADDPFTRKGLQLVVDGADPEVVRTVLESEMDNVAARHHTAVQTFEKSAGFAPTMGILGTVMGLVDVLRNLATPESVGPAISAAFIATLYGVGMANMVLFPVANRLKALSEAEQELYSLTLEGVLAIQAGDNPRIVAEKLAAFIPPDERPAALPGSPGWAGSPVASDEPPVERADEVPAAA
jgi:chemotaxis protein MotA